MSPDGISGDRYRILFETLSESVYAAVALYKFPDSRYTVFPDINVRLCYEFTSVYTWKYDFAIGKSGAMH